MSYVLLFAFLCLCVYVAFRRTPSDYNIDKIKDGDTKDQVRAAFGEPKDITRPGFMCAEEWTYTIPFRLFISIGFTADGKVNKRYRSGAAV